MEVVGFSQIGGNTFGIVTVMWMLCGCSFSLGLSIARDRSPAVVIALTCDDNLAWPGKILETSGIGRQ